MPILSISWPTLKSKFDGRTKILALTDRQISMLSTLAEQLTWQKTFRTEDYDWADKDELDAEVQDLIRWLTMGVDLADIIQYVDEIEDLLRLLQSPPGCCQDVDWTEGEEGTEPITENESNGIPAWFVDSGWADDDDDWDGFAEYQCHVANVIVNNLQTKVTSLEDIFDAAGVIVIGVGALIGLIGIIFGGGLSILVGGVLAGAGVAQSLYRSLVIGGPNAAPAPEEIELSRQALVCAWLDSANDGVDDRITALHDTIDDEFNVIEAEILKLLVHRSWLKAFYTGQYDDGTTTTSIAQAMIDQGIEPGTYECDCPLDPEAPTGYQWTIPTGINFSGITNVTGQSVSYDEGTGLLTLGVNFGAGTGGEWSVDWDTFDSIPCFRHAYAWYLQSVITDNDWEIKYNGRLDAKANGSGNGLWYAGYNTSLHSGQDWEDLVAQFDVTGNYTEIGHDRIRMVPEAAGNNWTTRTYVIKVLALEATT